MKRYYIAYGSNLNIRQMRIRCPHARVIGTAVINDYELLFKGSRTGAYLTIEPKVGSEVPVAVWEVTESDEAALDRYEGYPVFYYKKKWNSISGASAREDTQKEVLCVHHERTEDRSTFPFVCQHMPSGASALGLTNIIFPRHR